jgi:hypothetical protein
MAERKVVPFDEFYYQLKLMYLFQKHPVCYKWKNISENACMYKEKVTNIFIKLESDYLSVNYYLMHRDYLR